MTVCPYLMIWAYFWTKCDRVGFLLSKGKNWIFFFKNRKSTSTWLRSIQNYWRWKNKPQSIFLTTYHDGPHPKLEKIFLYYFYDGIMHNYQFEDTKMKENVLNMKYHTNSLETSSRFILSIHKNDSSIWTM